MEKEETKSTPSMTAFTAIMKKVYDKGRSETELTLEEIMEDLKTDLRNLVID